MGSRSYYATCIWAFHAGGHCSTAFTGTCCSGTEGIDYGKENYLVADISIGSFDAFWLLLFMKLSGLYLFS
jgi:hypothetical protein